MKYFLWPLVWSSTDENSVVISSASTTMINHLRDCIKQPKNIRAQAQDKKSSGQKKRGNQDDGYDDTEGDSPVVNRYHPYSTNFGNPMPPPQFTPFASTSSAASSHQGPYPQTYGSQAGYSGTHAGSREPESLDIPSIRTSLVDRRPSFSSRYDPYPPLNYPPSQATGSSFTGAGSYYHHNSPDTTHPGHGLPGPSRSPSLISSLGPMDSVSAVGSAYSGHSMGAYPQEAQVPSKLRGKKRARASTTAIQPWSDDRKKRWERLLIHLTASANFPLMWVQNPVWHTILDEFLPQAPRISRKVLTRRLLREAAADLREKAKAAVRGKQVTMQADGWTGINHHHLIAFMVTCDKKVRFVFTSNSIFNLLLDSDY
jgi:hypothetical protein